jgi:hypothetical protein
MELLTEWVEHESSAGRFSAYLARPAPVTAPMPGVVVIPEVWGVLGDEARRPRPYRDCPATRAARSVRQWVLFLAEGNTTPFGTWVCPASSVFPSEDPPGLWGRSVGSVGF